MVDGEPGIGKTTLAQALLADAETRGAVVFAVGTAEDGSAPAYGPWLDLLRGASGHPAFATGALDDLVEGTSRAVVAPAPAVPGAQLAEQAATAIASVAAGRGLVLLFEDLQWADPASLDLLCALGPRLGTAPVLILVTVRDLEIGRRDAVVDALAHLTRRRGTRRLTLTGLTAAESGELISRTAGTELPAEVVQALQTRCEGNPFFATELARMVGDEPLAWSGLVPTGIRDVLRHRIGQLPAATVQLLEVAAVLGRQTAVTLLATVADQPMDTCLDDLEPALEQRLISSAPEDPGAIRFTHALVRETLVDGLTSLRRARVHLRAADGIAGAGGASDDLAEVVAEHLWNAAALGVGVRAAAALETAAQVALRREALVSAESLLERAASLYRAANTEGGLAELRVLRQLGFVGAALHGYAVNADSPLVHRARELTRVTDRPDILLDLIWADWAGCDTGGQPARGERLVEEAEQIVASLDDPLLVGAVASMRGFTERHFGRMESAYTTVSRAVELLEEGGRAQEAGFYLNGYLTSRGFRHWARAMTRGIDRQALDQEYLAQDLPFARMVFALFGSAAHMAAGDHAGLALYSRRMIAADPEMQLSFWSSSAELYGAVSLLQSGSVRPGLDLYDRGRAHMRQAGGRTMLAGICAAGAEALFSHGAVEDGRRLLHEARVELEEAWELAYEPLVELAEAHRWAAAGDRTRMTARLDRAIEIATRHGSFGIVRRIEADREALLPA